ncbi:glycosyltransferase [Sulfurimonas autotrophica]|uniref:Glycosyl transferase family 1 domain-containing protein n=1 Tax=Sulfurimonas autotrophica (strain ATCC BAA-671 / DSM 16294 / JCM 11897 / OK10) TaxID=563040 RepID=E0UUN6_SULAO|nr:glycosyltransferase [Sulfurimonas autotrophica]ADN09540.1 hypothetical protein Saut_1493 [Sulfurimonas autotrophica DSM 16294]
MKILINALGIQDSGGITVLEKVLLECLKNKNSKYYIVCNDNKNIRILIEKYQNTNYLIFQVIKTRGFLYRLYYENIIFKKIIDRNHIDLVYNFSGSAQFFLKIPQLIKIQNLLFYSKKLDCKYKQKKQFILWLKQIFLKRLIFKLMINQASLFEIQSNHVKDYLSDYIDITNKNFYVKSDINVSNDMFKHPKQYDFTKKVNFLYIVGPHFEYIHKNFIDFTNAMIQLEQYDLNFQITVTLTKEQLNNSSVWSKKLDSKTNFLGYVNTKEEAENIFTNSTILVSTSIIETLGLHVVEAVQNGVLAISPEEAYAKSVYGRNMPTYKLSDIDSFLDTVKEIVLLDNNNIKDIILSNQRYLIKNEKTKYKSVVDIFDEILKEKDVQK